MDTTRSETHEHAAGRERSLSDPAQPHRRRSIGGHWFRRLGQKISGSEGPRTAAVDVPDRKRASTGSIYGTGHSDSHEDASPRTRDEFFRFARRGSVSSSTSAASSQPQPPASSPGSSLHSSVDDVRRVLRTRSRTQPEQDFSTSSDGLVDPLDSGPQPPKMPPGTPGKAASLADLERNGISTRHVGFALSTFADDPPQRIPPMKPLKGNVEFTKTGELILGPRPRHYQSTEQPYLERNHRDQASTAETRALQNAERLHASLSHSTTGGISSLFSGFSQKPAQEESLEQEEAPSRIMADQDVDGTAHVTRKHSHTASQGEDWVSHTPNESLSPEQIYIRCCHLREIMPIRNILRQLQGQHTPVPRLRIANTKPTLVEIQAFSDFLTVVPVASIALDNHVMTSEMLRLIFTGLARSRDITRLTLTNTDLDDEAWDYMCAFLASSRKTLLSMNLSCTNPTAIPDRVPAFTRSRRNWRLLSEALERMGSLEELDLSGTEIPVDDLMHLIKNGFQNGRVLGLANNKLTFPDVVQIAEWTNSPSSKLLGLNLSGNDLSQDRDLSVVESLLTNPTIIQLSLRNTNLTQAHAEQLVKRVSPEKAAKSSLRQLDLSRNPGLFPAIMNRLVESLSKYPFLSRLLLDHCGLSNDSIITICEAISHCHRLVFVSLLGNSKLNETAATAICVAVHQSRSICTVEADLQDCPAPLRQQLAKYCIQNLERNSGALGTPVTATEAEEQDISSFYDELRAVRNDVETGGEGLDAAAAARRIEGLRKELWTRVQNLLTTRQTRPLSVNEREILVRMYFFGNTLDRLQRQVTGTSPVSGTDVEEKVKNVDENSVRPAISRSASEASIRSLKKLEREEGHAHKVYADKIRTAGMPPSENIDKLQLGDLEKIIN